MRDSAVWNTADGVVAQWTRMGEGTVDIAKYIRTYVEKCPGCAISLELIMHRQRTFNYRDPEFWSAYRQTPAWEFARFLIRAEKGEPREPVNPDGRETVEDVADTVVARILDQLGLPNPGAFRWSEAAGE